MAGGGPGTSAEAAADPAEIARFAALAEEWWDPDGPMRALHRMNRARLEFLRRHAAAHFGRPADNARPLAGLSCLDIGCGAGLASEPLARMGARVVALDAAADVIALARRRADEQGLAIDYRIGTLDLLPARSKFDLVLALELLEHVPDPAGLLRQAVSRTRPGGALVLSTLNRTPRAYALGIVVAERVLRWAPVGTHRIDRFIKPAELRRWLAAAGARLEVVRGLQFSPSAPDGWRLGRDLSINYIAFAMRPPAG